jgi:hypothetical protein
MKRHSIAIVFFSVLCLLWMSAPSFALTEEGRYDAQTKEMPDALAGGWFINLGITGARGKMTPAAPTVMEVAYIFKGTPAYGKLKKGDKIIGANGKLFKIPHKFGYGRDKFGYEGPMMDIGNALEESQGYPLDGKLTFKVRRGSETLDIELKISTKYGQFGKTFPFNDKKTDLILKDVYAYLMKKQRGNGTWSRLNMNVFASLALLATKKPEYVAAAKRTMQQLAKETGSTVPNGGLQNWRYTLYGMALAEYYLATGEKWVLPELIEIRDALLGSQYMESGTKEHGGRKVKKTPGGWGHNRGFEGYGPIQIITGQGLAALGLMEQCGIEVPKERIVAAHQFMDRGTNSFGYVWYADGGKGNGGYADMGRTGIAAIAHNVSPSGGKLYMDRARLHATCIGTHFNTFHDTHASPLLGMAWTALGAAADPASHRKLMDEHKWFFNLSQNPDGTFYYQPNRDNNPQAYSAGPRITATCTMALIFATKYKSLRIMGAKVFIPGVNPSRLSVHTKKPFQLIGDDRYGEAQRLLVVAKAKLEGKKAPVVKKKTQPARSSGSDLEDFKKKNPLLALSARPRKKKTTLKSRPTGAFGIVKVPVAEDLEAINAMLTHIDKRLLSVLSLVKEKDATQDVLALKAMVEHHKKTWGGVTAFDELANPILKSFRVDPRRKELRLGAEYKRLREKAEKRPTKWSVNALVQFAKRNSDSYYAQLATADAKRLAPVTDAEKKKFLDNVRRRSTR